MRYLSKENLRKWQGKTCLLRVDLNIKRGQEKQSFRIDAILPTIKLLLKHKMKVVLLSHRGRPKSSDRNKYSLKPIVKMLEKRLKRSIIFIPYKKFSNAKNIIKSSKSEVFCLENLRFYPGEGQNSPIFAKKLAILGDFYVNEAFAASHRKSASMVILPRFLPHFAGLWLQKELKNLNLIMRKTKHPLTIIIGGAKISDKLGAIRSFINKADFFLLGGGPANTFLAARNLPINGSIYDEDALPWIKKLLTNEKIILPRDLKRKDGKILDIGPKTIESWREIINRSKTIIWSGPMGLFERKEFTAGTNGIWKAILKNRKAKIIVGGGETLASLATLMPADYKRIIADTIRGHRSKISANLFLSTGGGAMLEYLSGKKLPGLKALK